MLLSSALTRIFLAPGLAADYLAEMARKGATQRRAREGAGICKHCGNDEAATSTGLCEQCWSDTIV